MQRQIRKYLSSKKNKNKLFSLPPQNKSKSKNNYLFLNSTNDNMNEVETTNKTNSPENLKANANIKNNTPNEKGSETKDLIEKFKPNQEDDSFLNSEIKYIQEKY